MVDRQNGFGKQKRKEERQRQRRAKANRSQEKTQEETEKQKRAADLRRYTCFSLTTVAGKTCISLEHVLVESTYVYSTRREPKRHQRICVSAGSHLQSKMSYGTGHPTTNITTDPRWVSYFGRGSAFNNSSNRCTKTVTNFVLLHCFLKNKPAVMHDSSPQLADENGDPSYR